MKINLVKSSLVGEKTKEGEVEKKEDEFFLSVYKEPKY